MGSTYAQTTLRKPTFDWTSQYDSRMRFAVTLTLKPYRKSYAPNGYLTRQMLSPDIAWQTYEEFIARLNRAVFGNAARRYNKTVTCFPALEGEATGKLLHLHCAIGDVPTRSVDSFENKVREAWMKTPFGNNQVKVVPYRDAGWLDYITKEVRTNGSEFGWQHVRISSEAR